MKIYPKCGLPNDESSPICTNCGGKFEKNIITPTYINDKKVNKLNKEESSFYNNEPVL